MAMKVRMLSTAAGPDGVWPVHSLQDLPAEVALALIRGGHAVALASASSASAGEMQMAVVTPVTPEEGMTAAETAILEPLEMAETSRKRRKGR